MADFSKLGQFLRYLESQERPEFLPPQLDVMGALRQVLISNPVTAVREMPQKLAESQQMLENYQPGQQIDERLLNQFMGLTGFAPIGMTKPIQQGANLLEQATSYRGSHTAPNAEVYGATLDDLTKIMPKDVYSQQGKRLYGSGDPTIDHQWYMAALKAKGNPEAEVTVYRAVPKGVKEINSGDWVTTSKKYAENHGQNAIEGEFEILTKKVPAKKLSSEGYPYEFGYYD